MKVNRFNALQTYEAPNHFDMKCLRVQGHDASPAQSSWMGMSLLEPGGRTTLASSPVEKVYFVLDGALTVANGTDEQVLEKYDSCYFAPGESRELRNDSPEQVSVLLVMPYVDQTAPRVALDFHP